MIKRTKFNVSLLGEASVGKTCMINSLKGFPFDENQIATIGIDDVMDQAKFENNSYKFKIFDTAGQERYRSISTQTVQLADGFLIVFAVDSKQSFERVNYWIETIADKVSINQKALILVGNKCDVDENKRQVTKEAAEEFAASNKMKYFETSAKTGAKIKEVFKQLYKDIYILSKKLDKKEGDNFKLDDDVVEDNDNNEENKEQNKEQNNDKNNKDNKKKNKKKKNGGKC
jgi:small GTP-binding protein